MQSYINKGYAFFAEGKYAAAADCAQKILASSPTDPSGLLLAARSARMLGEPNLANQILDPLVSRFPNLKSLRTDLALALRDLAQPQAALEALNSLDGAQENLLRGEIYLSINDLEAAAKSFEMVLEKDQTAADAYRGLALCGNIALGDNHHKALVAATTDGVFTAADQYKALYTLSHVARQYGDSQGFIRYLNQANLSQRTLLKGSQIDYQKIFDASIVAAKYRRSEVHDDTNESGKIKPIFILGMPRSGTSLVESVIASSPVVFAGGEINFFNRSLAASISGLFRDGFPLGFAHTTLEYRQDWSKRFQDLIEAMAGKGRFVTDKTPGNFHIIGVIKTLFPNSKIIHVRRDPIDTCFSILQYPFAGNVPHTCDMVLLGYYYSRYLELMEAWRHAYRDEILEVNYEEMVRNPKQLSQTIFNYCGLEWDDTLLESRSRGGAVRTFSSQQVRKGVYTTSIGASAEFEDFLSPLRQSLEDHGVALGQSS